MRRRGDEAEDHEAITVDLPSDVWIVDRAGAAHLETLLTPHAFVVSKAERAAAEAPSAVRALVPVAPRRDAVLVATSGGVVADPDDLVDLAARARSFAEGARSASTRRAYASDWRAFEGWCATRDLPTLPTTPAIVGLYLAAHAETLAVATLARRLAAIAVAHRSAGFRLDCADPAIHDVMKGLRRENRRRPRQVEALTVDLARDVVPVSSERLLDLRDRALLLLGLGAGLRRSEIVALDVEDVVIEREGARITVRRSKTDQESAGHVVGIVRTGRDTCPVAAVEAWVDASGVSGGRLLRSVDRHGRIGERLSDRTVARVVQRHAARVGLDPARYAGHSLRAGLATSAAREGVEERDIMATTGHHSTAVLRRYVRQGALYKHSLTAKIGL